jgi:hypothetical protein
MKIMRIKFEKPKTYEIEQCGGHAWSFVVETDVELPHGYSGFGGILRKVDGDWQARAHVSQDWGGSRRSREDAIENILTQSINDHHKLKNLRDEERAEIERRGNYVRSLNAGLPNNIALSASNVHNLNEVLNFHIRIRDLDISQVKKWVSILKGAA